MGVDRYRTNSGIDADRYGTTYYAIIRKGSAGVIAESGKTLFIFAGSAKMYYCSVTFPPEPKMAALFHFFDIVFVNRAFILMPFVSFRT